MIALVTLPDFLKEGLKTVICGTVASTSSAGGGHYYAGPGNEFWGYLHESQLTDVRLKPEDDHRVLEFGVGLTDLVKAGAASTDRGLEGFDVPGFVKKIERYQPHWVAFHGKAAPRKVMRGLGLRGSVRLGRQFWLVAGRPVFVLPSASGSNRDPRRLEGKASRLAWYQEFADQILDNGAVTDV